MAQKRRGLGRGLQALIPEAQAEVPGRRPSDVFFPESGRSRVRPAEGAMPSEQTETAGSDGAPAPTRHADEIAATLLAPSKRQRQGGSRKPRSARSAGARAAASAPSARSADVSRETSQASSEPRVVPGAARSSVERSSASGVTEAVSASPVGEPRGLDDLSESGRTHAAAEESASVAGGAGAAVDHGGAGACAQDAHGSSVEETAGAPAVAPPGEDSQVSAEELVPVPGTTFAELPIDAVVPNPQQPRQVFDEDDIAELADSIREVGLLQPIVVRRASDDVDAAYELIMGERRLRAAREAGLESIPAIVRYTADEDLLRDALLENLHRVQLNPLEEAAAYQQLLEDFNCTQAELSERIARSRSQISNTLRLMKLPPLVQRRLAAGVLSAGHARALLGLPDAAAMERLAQRIVAEGLSVRATEELVALYDEPVNERPARVLRARSATLPALSTRLSDAFDTRVKVTKGAKKGRITIEFAGDEDLARIVQALAPGTSLEED